MTLTVTVDARVLFDEVPRGIAQATAALYRALAAARPGWRFRMAHQQGMAARRRLAEADPFAGLANVEVLPISLPGDRFQAWQRLALPMLNARTRGPKVFHAPAGPAPWPLLKPLVATIYDLIPLDLGGPLDAAGRVWARRVRRAARHARRVLTASEHAKGRIVAHFGVPPERVAVVPLAPLHPPAAPPSPARRAELAREYGLGEGGAGYVLHFGMDDPRKNTLRLIEEWGRIPAAARGGARLLVIGLDDAARRRFGAGADAGVRLAGYAPASAVGELLAGAAVLAYPSQYEGFGLPILDGFAAGVPVLCGDRTSLPEVAGDAAELVDPHAPGALAAGLGRLLADAGRRAELVARGRARVAQFSWAAAAERVAAEFEAAGG